MSSSIETHTLLYSHGAKTLSYLSAGPASGPLIIFLHGWPAIAQTWEPQITTFSSLGFRVLAPDMPGYGNSTAEKKISDYSQEAIQPALLALLASTGREKAIWVGHDWGCGPLWTLAATAPHVCTGVIGLSVPYRTLEFGLDALRATISKEIYPPETYPNGPWDYQVYYEQSFEKAVAWHNLDIPGFLRVMYRKGNPATYGQPAATSSVVRDGGWLGGMKAPPPAEATPDERTTLGGRPEMEKALVKAMQRTGFYTADAWYMNHEANKAFNTEKSVNGGVLNMPVLFIQARFDAVCDTTFSTLAGPMRASCKNLTETVIDAGHWVALEKPEEVNAAITRWIVEELKGEWPGFWTNTMVKAGSKM